MYDISYTYFTGDDTTWNGLAGVPVGAHFGVANVDATTASFLGSGAIVNQGSAAPHNFIADENFLGVSGLTDFHFAAQQTGLGIFLRHATAVPGNGFTFYTSTGPVDISLHNIFQALGTPDPNIAYGGFANLGITISGLSPLSDMAVHSYVPHHGFGMFTATNYDFNYHPVPGTPEIGTWAMLLFGFAAMGVTAVRRRKARATA